jgi:hypothetical protein
VLSVIDPATGAVDRRIEVGACAADLLVEPGVAWVAAFEGGGVDRVDLTTGQIERLPSGGARPLRLARLGAHVYALDADSLRVRELDTGAEWSLPVTGKNAPFLAESADALIPWAGRLVVTAHAVDRFRVLSLDPATGEVAILHERQALFGQVGFDSGNSAFRMCGQYGDAVFTLTPWDVDAAGRLWIADFLSGRVLSIAE